jgi:hypothetical protein
MIESLLHYFHLFFYWCWSIFIDKIFIYLGKTLF